MFRILLSRLSDSMFVARPYVCVWPSHCDVLHWSLFAVVLVRVLISHGGHLSRKKPGNVGEFNRCWEVDQKFGECWELSGKNLVGYNCLLLTAHFGLYQCLVVSHMHICCTVKHDVGNCKLGGSAVKRRGKCRGNFTVAGEWSPWFLCCFYNTMFPLRGCHRWLYLYVYTGQDESIPTSSSIPLCAVTNICHAMKIILEI